jgi:dienelactone hydrolase
MCCKRQSPVFLSAGVKRWFARITCLVVLCSTVTTFAQVTPPSEAFRILPEQPVGPSITPYLRYQTDLAWRQDEARIEDWRKVQTEDQLQQLQSELRKKLLAMLGGLPRVRTPLRPQITGRIQMSGFHIEKLIFESMPGLYVTALVYVPDSAGGESNARKHPAILVAAGHAADGKVHYQTLCQRLVQRGYVVISWDPVGQGERSQFWGVKAGKSRYNLICAEHAILGNLAYLAGTDLARWEIWDGLRAFDYLLTRPDVDPDRISITGTSGGGTQAMYIAALEPRIKVAAISCYITSLPMRMHNRIFKDPDSDPEQDLYGMVSNGVDHAGLLLLMYPRPVFVAAAVLDFFPIEGTKKTFREAQQFYIRFGHSDRIAMTEGYHGHQFSDGNQLAAFEFLDHFNGLPLMQALPATNDLDAKSVQCTRTGQVMLDFPNGQPLTHLIRDFYLEHKGQAVESVKDQYFNRGYPGIHSWQLDTYEGIDPVDGEIGWQLIGTSTFDGVVIDRYTLHHSSSLVMPLIYVHKASNTNKKWEIWLGENGMAQPSDWPELLKQVQQGFDVISFDFRGLGETRMRYKALSEDDPSFASLDYDHAYVNPLSSVLADYVYNSLLTGRPFFLQMIEDVEIATRFAQLKFGADHFSLVAGPDCELLASTTAGTLDGITRTPSSNTPPMKWSDIVEHEIEVWPIQWLMPGGAYIQ